MKNLHNTREIEKKFLVNTRKSITSVFKDLSNCFKNCASSITEGSGTDYFFSTDKVSILRIREYDEGGGELTIKNNDRRTIINREEINLKLETAADVEMAKILITRLHGPPSYQVWKKYFILWLPKYKGNVVVYQTNLNKIRGIFLEAEAKTVCQVNSILSRLGGIYELMPITKSLYQLTAEDSNGKAK